MEELLQKTTYYCKPRTGLICFWGRIVPIEKQTNSSHLLNEIKIVLQSLKEEYAS